MKQIFLGLLLICPQWLSPPRPAPKLIVWDVGQGQWVSLIHPNACYHFDLGGEHFPPRDQLKELCLKKLNFALLSHWDWDHIRLARKALRQLPNLCVAAIPRGEVKAQKRAFLGALGACSVNGQNIYHELEFDPRVPESNAQSRVFQIAQRVLNPADSGIEQERLWISKLKNQALIDFLIVGHHGSKTSTSEALLEKLKGLRQAVISARYRRYKHPHWSVEAKLRAYGVSPLRTEDWGNIHLEIRD